MQYQSKGYPVNPFMGVNKEKIQSDGIIDKLKFIIVVTRDFQNKDIV